MQYRVVSIGSLSCHELWGEKVATRTPHATTTLVQSGNHVILVDPGLPTPAMVARLKERSGLDPSAVTDVFLTNFRPAHRRALPAFDSATWYISELERQFVGQHLVQQFKSEQMSDTKQLLDQEMALLQRCVPAPDRLADKVDLFPLPGYSPGTCGLLLSHINWTTLIAGDAVATVEHLDQGRVLKGCYDTAQARDSLSEAVEIADVIVPGHDNLLANPSRRPM